MQPRSLLIANRTPEKAATIASLFGRSGLISACSFDEVPVDEPYDLVINATSAGLSGTAPPFPAATISDRTFCYDLSYSRSPTPFCLWARDNGAAKSVMGWGMLVEQAAESFNLWRGIRPDTAPVLKQMLISA
jgi:shikimate dehydrogenase